ncbi:MAG: AAA family ATPase [Oscillospiraceae bacterium]|jgi:shikimate kinase|nr:AAA family ATPase [Oscillospiraceae bacterium]MDD3260322.1 AAA family ATPase [Oscillospiraceae bacterium]
MKKLFLIGGPMGVGKTAVAQCLKEKLPDAVFLDGDWCWDASPFCVTEETKDMVMNNICYLLNSFVHCSAYDNIIFCWVMHEQEIIDTIINRVDVANCEVKIVSLTATKETLAERILKDVKNGIRTADVLDRSIARLPLYQRLTSIKIVTDGKSIQEVAEEISVL